MPGIDEVKAREMCKGLSKLYGVIDAVYSIAQDGIVVRVDGILATKRDERMNHGIMRYLCDDYCYIESKDFDDEQQCGLYLVKSLRLF